MSMRVCVNKADSFCYICGEVTAKAYQKPISSLVKKAYELYFGCKVGDQDRSWAPKMCCSSCSRTLTGCLKGTHKSMPFAVPMVWREPRNHVDDCYFCMTNIKGITSKSKRSIQYPNIPSAMRPVPHYPFPSHLRVTRLIPNQTPEVFHQKPDQATSLVLMICLIHLI